MWHFRMKKKECADFKNLLPNGTPEYTDFPTNTSYPAGTICATEDALDGEEACLTAGDSGSPLMEVKMGERHYVQGVMSFTRSCFANFGKFSVRDREVLEFVSTSPSVYTKLSCFLPWVAEQYNMTWKNSGDPDPDCSVSRGDINDFNQTYCGTFPDARYESLLEQAAIDSENDNEDNDNDSERQATETGDQFYTEAPCLFPYFYNGKYYDGCLQFAANGFVVPAYYCPIFNIQTKEKDPKTGNYINSYPKASENRNQLTDSFRVCSHNRAGDYYVNGTDFQAEDYYSSATSEWILDRYNNISDCKLFPGSRKKFRAFALCKNNCKGGKTAQILILV